MQHTPGQRDHVVRVPPEKAQRDFAAVDGERHLQFVAVFILLVKNRVRNPNVYPRLVQRGLKEFSFQFVFGRKIDVLQHAAAALPVRFARRNDAATCGAHDFHGVRLGNSFVNLFDFDFHKVARRRVRRKHRNIFDF